MKILIIRFSSIGDIVLTTPVVRCLKKQLPNCTIHYATKAAFANIVLTNPYIDKVLKLEDYEEEIIEQAKLEQYDWIIDLHHNLRTLKIKKALKKVKSKSFYKLNIQKWLMVALKINKLPNTHIVDRYMDTVAHLGVKNDGQGLDYFIPEKDKVQDNDIPTSHLAGYIGLVIGAAHATKQFPIEKLKALCAAIQHPIILLGGKEDVIKGNEIAALDTFKIYNACGKFNLNESADLVSRSKFIITNDTGLMHIAAAFKKPIISLWGNTIPAFGMTPYYGNYNVTNVILENKNLSCRPCSKIGYDKCPKGHFKCMNQIDDAILFETVQRFLNR
jgi:ADP-heptose:LPS heptosyltransferase